MGHLVSVLLNVGGKQVFLNVQYVRVTTTLYMCTHYHN